MLTTTQISELSWAKVGIIPVIIQHNVSGEVLMHGYMNKDALKKTLLERQITFFSRTRNRLWTKGETSGYVLNLVSITPDCDQDALLATVNPIGPTCHLKKSSCFFPLVTDVTFLYQFETLLAERKNANPTTSYTAKLYASGTKRIAQKVGEEGIETALAAVDNNRHELVNELSDLFYHILVLMQDQDIKLSDIVSNLRNRHKSK